MQTSELRQIRNLLIEAIDDLENTAARDLPRGSWPSLHSPISANQQPHRKPDVQKLCSIITAAAYQLICLVREPFSTLIDAAGGVSLFRSPPGLANLIKSLLTTALNTANELNVAEILREGDNEGIDISEIAARCKANPDKLGRLFNFLIGIDSPFLSGRCLRTLATHHIFREVRPNVFANNRVSSLLDTGIPHQKIQQECVH